MIQTDCPHCFTSVLAHLRGMMPRTEFYRIACQSCGKVATGTVTRGKDWKPKADKLIYERKIENVSAQPLIVEQMPNIVEVPAWALRADLGEDYRDFARLYGEEDAASRCRALLREMKASA